LSHSDSVLVKAVLEGDKQSYGQLYDRYAGLVMAICYDATGDYSQTQDLAQEVFLRAYKLLGRLEDADRFGGWLVSIARNVCREYRRGKFRDRHVLVGLEPPEKETQATENKDDTASELHEAMRKLTEKERLALHVYYLQEQSAQKAQKLLGVSRSGLYRLLEKARKKVGKFIEEEREKNN